MTTMNQTSIHRMARRPRGVLAALALLGALAVATPACETTYQFEDIEVGEGDGDRAPRAKSNSQFLRSLYADLLGRNPESYDFVITFDGIEALRLPLDEQATLEGTLDGVGDPTPLRALIVAGLVTAAEAQIPQKSQVEDPEAFIAEQFRKFLGRDPGPYELDAFVNEWESDPAVNPKTIIRALIGSREYQSF